MSLDEFGGFAQFYGRPASLFGGRAEFFLGLPRIFCYLAQLLRGPAKLFGDGAVLLGGSAPGLGCLAIALRVRLIRSRLFTPNLTGNSSTLGGFARMLGLATSPFRLRSPFFSGRRVLGAHEGRIHEPT